MLAPGCEYTPRYVQKDVELPLEMSLMFDIVVLAKASAKLCPGSLPGTEFFSCRVIASKHL